MVALNDAGVSPKAVSVLLQCSVWTVRRWVQRNDETGNLDDLPRSGLPVLYSQETKQRIVAFYCQTTPFPNCGRWSLRWAARHLEANPKKLEPNPKEQNLSPSKSTIHRILKDNHLKPHQSRYFLHITDPDFFPKMEHLIALYTNPPPHLFFFDECPGIQVLKRLLSDLQTNTMKQRLEEFEYIRNGTLDVFAFLCHADGKVAIECHADHTIDTFLGVFKRHVAGNLKTEPLHYVMDNLASHRSYRFCQLVAQLSGVCCPPEKQLCTQDKRVVWLGRDDKRIVIHFTPFHGSWLNWVEIWFGIMGRKVLNESFAGPDDLIAALMAFENEWNLLLAHPFHWTYDGQGLHDKVVKRITAMFQKPTDHLDLELRTLTKLLTLLTNMLNNYFSKVSDARWAQLMASLSKQSEHIAVITEKETGPLRKKKAEIAIANLNEAIHNRAFLPNENIAA